MNIRIFILQPAKIRIFIHLFFKISNHGAKRCEQKAPGSHVPIKQILCVPQTRCWQQRAQYALQDVDGHAISQQAAKLNRWDNHWERRIDSLQTHLLSHLQPSPTVGHPMTSSSGSGQARAAIAHAMRSGRTAVAVNDPRTFKRVLAARLYLPQKIEDVCVDVCVCV